MTKKLRKIALVGLRASGKSTIGRALATRLALPFVDLDHEVVTQANIPGLDTCAEVLVALGEPAFREIETLALRAVLARRGRIVLATGGGVVESPVNRGLLAGQTTVVWIKVGVAILQARLRNEVSVRPPLLGKSTVDEVPLIAARRAPLYAEAANHVLEADVGDPDTLAERIQDLLAREGAGGGGDEG